MVAKGSTRSGGWTKAELKPQFVEGVVPKGGVYKFEFMAEPPTGGSTQRITPIEASYHFGSMPPGAIFIEVEAETNTMDVSVAKG